MEPGGWSGARRPEARGPQADYMQPTRVLETPSSAADVCSLYVDKSAEKQSKISGGPDADYKHPTRDLETASLALDVGSGLFQDTQYRLKQPKNRRPNGWRHGGWMPKGWRPEGMRSEAGAAAAVWLCGER